MTAEHTSQQDPPEQPAATPAADGTQSTAAGAAGAGRAQPSASSAAPSLSPAADGAEDESILSLDEHVEEVSEDGLRVQRRGIFLLPNLLTTGALFAGFLAIIQSLEGQFGYAALAIFAAALLDGLDGRIARLTHAQSAFGQQYDSLSDVVSFGVAPALVVYHWGLAPLQGFGQIAAFVYTACTALRLAHFNTRAQDGSDDRQFIGLASPAAAVLLSSLAWFSSEAQLGGTHLLSADWAWLACIFTVATGLLMLLKVPYRSFKEIDFRGRVPFASVLIVLLLFAIIAVNPPRMLLLLSSLYALSGPASMLWSRIQRHRG